MDYTIEIPGLPLSEIANYLFRLDYKIWYENMRMNGTINFRFRINLEATYLKNKHPLKNMVMDTHYEAAASPFSPVMVQFRGYVLLIRNNVFNLINLPLEDIPLHINDPEPYNDIAAWRLYLPRPDSLLAIFNLEDPE